MFKKFNFVEDIAILYIFLKFNISTENLPYFGKIHYYLQYGSLSSSFNCKKLEIFAVYFLAMPMKHVIIMCVCVFAMPTKHEQHCCESYT